jgi:putative DNA primase/helicase
MRDGAAIARALGGKRIKNGWKFRCPRHDDHNPSAVIYDSGWIVCFAKCDRKEIEAKLDELDLRDNGQPAPPRDSEKERADRQTRVREVQQMWEDFAPSSTQWWAEDFSQVDPLRPQLDEDVAVVVSYLKRRGILLPVPAVLRRWNVNGYMAALQQLNGEITAVHTRTATGVRLTHGPMEGGAVQLTPLKNEHLALAEGIETALSVTQMFQIPCWATLGSKRLHCINIPDQVRVLHFFIDNDEPGHEALRKAIHPDSYYRQNGYELHYSIADPHVGKDWNDVLKELA